MDNSKKFDFCQNSKIQKVKKASCENFENLGHGSSEGKAKKTNDFDFQLVEFNTFKIYLNEGEVFVGRYSQAQKSHMTFQNSGKFP